MKRIVIWVLLCLLFTGTATGDWVEARYEAEEIGLQILAPSDWVVEDAQSVERINVMQIDDKLTHPRLLLSMAKQDANGLRRIELSMEKTNAFSCALVYSAAMLVDLDLMFLQLGENPSYGSLLWPETEWPGVSIRTEGFVWSYWVIPHEDAFFILQMTHSADLEGALEEILALIEVTT